MAQIVPLTNAPNQTVQPVLAINGTTIVLNLSVSFNQPGNFWVMNIADQFGNPLVNCVPLLTGAWPAANILAPFDWLQIGSAYLISQNGALTDFPDDTNLGSGFVLLWDSNPSYAQSFS